MKDLFDSCTGRPALVKGGRTVLLYVLRDNGSNHLPVEGGACHITISVYKNAGKYRYIVCVLRCILCRFQ